ncbi:GGDEF domain-containing protein [Clostridium aminobutyricum]|uniref:GGDEF domain-containing protein n=1 Tax=Clostridium aminobutyricum TaxID=33953 RepID=A0A939D8Z7_CLOAM|nr:GGDEF domain-containing protein [Clostridium aminobutyricum]MBN7773386.1 GGDEF domain-containing protein [Clostridium aminobutyricum]
MSKDIQSLKEECNELERRLNWLEEKCAVLMEQSEAMVHDYDYERDTMVYSSKSPNGSVVEHTIEAYRATVASNVIFYPNLQHITIEEIRLSKEKSATGEVDYLAEYKAGERKWYRTYYTSFQYPDGKPMRLIGITKNIQREKEHELLVIKAEKDGLSELYNRDSTEERIRKLLAAPISAGKHLFVLFDIDNFKKINDTYGHIMGDDIIKRVARIISSKFRTSDIIGRIGGDEFVAFLRNAEYNDLLKKKLERINHEVCQMSSEKMLDVDLSLSIGVARIPKDGCSFEEVYLRADRALYQAKNLGKGRYVLYKKSKKEHAFFE